MYSSVYKVIIGSSIDLLAVRCKGIAWTNDDLFVIECLGTYFSEI